jgi:flagellar motor switch protein FliG
MAAAGSQHKIRQLAIVLSSIDSPAAARILNSMPPQFAGSIRQQIQKLGAVAAAEREAAFEALRPILKSSAASSDKRNQPIERHAQQSEKSPAEQLLADGFQQQDYADIGHAANNLSNQQPDAPSKPAPSELAINWNDASGKLWAELLQIERPILIATVIAHAPETLACEILQELPSTVALDTLASMPKIGSTELAILTEIAGQLNTRLQSLGQRSAAGGWGLQRAKGIVESLPPGIRQQWVKQLEQIDESVARELMIISQGNENTQDASMSQNDAVDATFAAMHTGQSTTSKKNSTSRLKVAEHTRISDPLPATYTVGNSVDDSFDDATEAAVVAYDAEDFEALLNLSRANLARVVRRCHPETILVALSGASRKWVTKFESLMHPKDHARLRARLKGLGTTPIKLVDEAQASIVAIAVEMRLFDVPRDVLAA